MNHLGKTNLSRTAGENMLLWTTISEFASWKPWLWSFVSGFTAHLHHQNFTWKPYIYIFHMEAIYSWLTCVASWPYPTETSSERSCSKSPNPIFQLVGGWKTILKNMSSSMGRMTSIHIMENKSHVWNHQPDNLWFIQLGTYPHTHIPYMKWNINNLWNHQPVIIDGFLFYPHYYQITGEITIHSTGTSIQPWHQFDVLLKGDVCRLHLRRESYGWFFL